MKIFTISIICGILILITVGTVLATPTVFDDSVIVEKPSGSSAIVVKNDDSSAVFKLENNKTGSQIYQFRLRADASHFDIIDITNNRNGFTMSTSNGNVGIGVGSNPTEQLHVDGNIRLTGNLTSTSTINIKPGSDICIGSSC